VLVGTRTKRWREALASLSAQSRTPDAVVVVDAGSGEATPSKRRAQGSRFRRVAST
jgi:GT2 family glycosyltransferase